MESVNKFDAFLTVGKHDRQSRRIQHFAELFFAKIVTTSDLLPCKPNAIACESCQKASPLVSRSIAKLKNEQTMQTFVDNKREPDT